MKLKNYITILLGFTSFFIMKEIVFPYDNVNSHPTFNDAAVNFLVLNEDKYFDGKYKLKILSDATPLTGTAVTNPGYSYASYGESEVNKTAFEWIKHGGFSADEPEFAAAVRHFYDPLALNGGAKYLTNKGMGIEYVYSNPHIDAIEWALGDTKKGEDNNWSLKKAKNFMKSAFELADDNMRKNNFAKAYRGIGEVLHNTADMGCPPHTRNDSHAAPLGYSKGAILGSPDPYEELFNPFWIFNYMYLEPDPELKLFFDSADNVRSIDEKMAEFTNKNFFTEETMNGFTSKLIEPVNDECTYPTPLLQNLEYDISDFTFYKTFPSGRIVKMAKDLSYFTDESYPYIDKDCVLSQAKELIPNIVYASSNILRLFIPKIELQITSANSEGFLTGHVKHIPTMEYNELFYFTGAVNIYKKNNTSKIGTLNCNTGDYSGMISGLQKDDEIFAEIELGGINIRSDNFKVDDKPEVVKNYTTAYIDLNIKGYHIRTNADTTYEDQYFKYYTTDSPDQFGTTDGLNFSSSWYQTTTDNYPVEGTTITKSGTISITFSENYESIKTYTETFSISWPGWYENSGGVSVKDIPLYQRGDEWTPDVFKLDYGEDACNHVLSRSYNQTWWDGSSFIFSRNECDNSSYIKISLYEN